MTDLATTTVAAFDVDGTVTERDCVVPFLRRTTGTSRLVARLGVRPDRMVPPLLRRDRDRLKALAAAAAFRGRQVDEIEGAAREFARFVHEAWLRRDTVDLIEGHLAAGDTVLFVSASFELYLRPLAELLGVDDVLGTRLDVSDGVFTGALDGPNCRGPEKVRRLHGWLDEHAGGRDGVRIVAYGDSAGDREMLADADEAHWIGPTRLADDTAEATA